VLGCGALLGCGARRSADAPPPLSCVLQDVAHLRATIRDGASADFPTYPLEVDEGELFYCNNFPGKDGLSAFPGQASSTPTLGKERLQHPRCGCGIVSDPTTTPPCRFERRPAAGWCIWASAVRQAAATQAGEADGARRTPFMLGRPARCPGRAGACGRPRPRAATLRVFLNSAMARRGCCGASGATRLLRGGSAVARCGAAVARCGAAVARCGAAVACCGAAVARCGAAVARCGGGEVAAAVESADASPLRDAGHARLLRGAVRCAGRRGCCCGAARLLLRGGELATRARLHAAGRRLHAAGRRLHAAGRRLHAAGVARLLLRWRALMPPPYVMQDMRGCCAGR